MPRSPPTRRATLAALAAWSAAAWPARAAALYRIDQRYGTISFAVSVLGLFSIEGRFRQFQGELLLDIGQPEQSRIDVVVDTAAVEMPLAEQVELLRSEAYLDTVHHPSARFVSEAIEARPPARYLIRGRLTLRGVTQPVLLDARLTDRQRDEARRIEVADFLVTGAVSRSAFGMVADRLLLADRVRLDIRIRLTVGADGG